MMMYRPNIHSKGFERAQSLDQSMLIPGMISGDPHWWNSSLYWSTPVFLIRRLNLRRLHAIPAPTCYVPRFLLSVRSCQERRHRVKPSRAKRCSSPNPATIIKIPADLSTIHDRGRCSRFTPISPKLSLSLYLSRFDGCVV